MPANVYAVAGQKPGYFDGLAGERKPSQDAFTLRFGADGFRRIKLGQGQWLDNVVVKLWPPGSISGRVVDERGEPIVARFIRVLRTGAYRLEPPLTVVGAALTDDRGVFSIGRLVQGRYLVAVLPFEADALAAGADSRYVHPLQFFPSARRSADATPIDVAFGENVEGVNLTLVTSVPHTVAGRVEGPAEAHRQLQLVLSLAGEPFGGTTTQIGRTHVEPNGTFAFRNIPAGDYILSTPLTSGPEVRPAYQLTGGPRPWESPSVVSGDRGYSSDYWVQTQVRVTTTDVRDLVVPAYLTATITGRVVRDRSGDTTVRLPESIALRLAGSASSASYIVRLAPDGSFTIRGLRGGEYYLAAVGGVIQSLSLSGREHRHLPISVEPGRDVNDLIITVTLGASLSGFVRHDQLASLLTRLLSTSRRMPPYWTDAGLRSPLVGCVPVASDGSYETAASLPAGEYFAVAISEDWRDSWQNSRFLEAAARVATPFQMARAEKRVQNLQLQLVSK